MTAPNLIAIVGAGSALTLAGFALVGGAAGVALAYFFPQIHLGIWLLIIGVVMLILGLTLVERGGTKTVEKVENEFSMPKVVSNFPWTFVGLGAGAGLFIYWLFRSPRTEVTRTEIKPVYVPAPTTSTAYTPPPQPKRLTLADVLVPLGSAAASYAASVGMKALGVPSPKDLLSAAVHKFMRGSSDSNGAHSQPDGAKRGNYEAAMRRS